MFNLLKKIGLLSIEVLGNEKVKKRIAIKTQELLTDDQIVQKIITGLDERQLVIIALTNKKLYVIGDTVLHEINKEDIYEVKCESGMLHHLIETTTIKDEIESVFFKVFSKKAITTLEDWLE